LTDPTKQTESEKQIEYEYRDAEYEYEPNTVNQGGKVLPSRTSLSKDLFGSCPMLALGPAEPLIHIALKFGGSH
jgi:hypothetical protein